MTTDQELIMSTAVAGLGGGAAVALARHRLAEPTDWYEITFPRDVPETGVEAFLRTIAGDRRPFVICFELVVRAQDLRYFMAAPGVRMPELARTLRAVLPGVVVQPVHRAEIRASRYACSLTVRSHHRPLQAGVGEAVSRSLLAGLQALDGDETVTVQYLLGPRRPARPIAAVLPIDTAFDVSRELLRPGARPSTEHLRSAREKHGAPSFRLAVRFGFAVDSLPRAKQLSMAMLAAFRQAEGPGVKLGLHATPASHVTTVRAPWRWPLRLNDQELGSLLAWPIGEGDYPGLDRTGPRLVPPHPALPDFGRIVGQSTWPGPERPLALTPADSLRHVHALGPTGAGKSTLLLNLITQDMNQGRGVVVIDPKGDLITDVLARVPARRNGDVVVLDPADEDRPVGLNPLTSAGSPELVADQLLAVMHGLYREHWGPRTQDVLHAALLTIAKVPGMTICALPVLLTNPGFRRTVTAGEDDLALAPFWAWYESLSEAERGAVIAPVMNKLRAFLLRPRMRAVLGQAQPKFTMTEVFTRKRILLVSLAEGLLGPEASALLGALVISQLWQTTLGRSSVPVERRHPVFAYIDEFQQYLHLPTDLAEVLAAARSHGLGLTLAHQHLTQLPIAMRAAILSNARSRICFQLGVEDAATIARTAPNLTAEDLQALPAFHAYAALMANGAVTPYASIRTLPPPQPTGDPDSLRRASREHYGVDRTEVEAALRALVIGNGSGTTHTTTIGSRRRTRP